MIIVMPIEGHAVKVSWAVKMAQNELQAKVQAFVNSEGQGGGSLILCGQPDDSQCVWGAN